MRGKLRLACLLAIAAAPCRAQVATGNIRGTVVDSSGGVLQNCSVVISSSRTGFRRSILTNERGDFNAPLVPIGTCGDFRAPSWKGTTRISGRVSDSPTRRRGSW